MCAVVGAGNTLPQKIPMWSPFGVGTDRDSQEVHCWKGPYMGVILWWGGSAVSPPSQPAWAASDARDDRAPQQVLQALSQATR